jgi:two-component system, OmpR family, response regulator RegX3
MVQARQYTHTARQTLRILIVEDERDVLEMLREVLASEGHTVIAVPDGETALASFQAQHCDIVFTDLSMPGFSGWDVAGRIKKLDRSVPVVLLTGGDVYFEQAELKTKGVDCFIKKPFSIAVVLQALADLCGPRKNAGYIL